MNINKECKLEDSDPQQAFAHNFNWDANNCNRVKPPPSYSKDGHRSAGTGGEPQNAININSNLRIGESTRSKTSLKQPPKNERFKNYKNKLLDGNKDVLSSWGADLNEAFPK